MSGLDQLLGCNREELILRWRHAFASSPPKHTSTQLMQKALAYDLQCKAEGDSPIRSRRVLKHALKTAHMTSKAPGAASLRRAGGATGDTQMSSAIASVHALSAGVQLVREWNGRTWRVEVLEDGFTCNGKTHRRLSSRLIFLTKTWW